MGACVHARTHAYTYITPGVHQFALALDAHAPPGERLRHRRAHSINEERAAAALVREGGREGWFKAGCRGERGEGERYGWERAMQPASSAQPRQAQPSQPASPASLASQSSQPACSASQAWLRASFLGLVQRAISRRRRSV